jgi:hypothetical protein
MEPLVAPIAVLALAIMPGGPLYPILPTGLRGRHSEAVQRLTGA